MIVGLCLCVSSAQALFGFTTKRFRYEGLIDAGSLGLNNLDGQIVALGDWNSDSAIDLFILSKDKRTVTLYLWDHAQFTFVPYPSSITVPQDKTIVNVIPADFNYDGRLDILTVMEGSVKNELEMLLWLGKLDGGIDSSPKEVPPAYVSEPFSVDFTGDMHTDLIAHSSSTRSTLSVWKNRLSYPNSTSAFEIEDAILSSDSSPSCTLANPHSSAFIDLDGDCLADVFLVCKDSSNHLTYQIWTASRSSEEPKYVLARHGSLPPNSGPLSFADMDRDGTIDVVFPSCDSKNGPCYINITYNKQVPLCSDTRKDWFGVGPGGTTLRNSTLSCRDAEANLCTPDPGFSFDFTIREDNEQLSRIPLSSITPDQQLLHDGDIPITLTLGDYNRDGYPDIAAITVPSMKTSKRTHLRLLTSVGCDAKGKLRPGCPTSATSKSRHRTFEMVRTGVEAIETIGDAMKVSFFDIDEDGSLDLLVQRGNAKAMDLSVTFIQNNFFYDAFFLKAMTSNGACSSYCEKETRYRPWGVNYGGASYKFTVLDTDGIRRAQQVGQLQQTAYKSMQLPYAYFGLGRTNNYVESLFVGTTRRRATNFIELEGVIPNSQVVILPWEPTLEGQPEGYGLGQDGDASTWRRELYLSPGEWIPWVTVVLATIVVILLGFVFVLHLHEKVCQPCSKLAVSHPYMILARR